MAVANGLDWQAGDEVVSVEGEFPANDYPWKVQEKKGITDSEPHFSLQH